MKNSRINVKFLACLSKKFASECISSSFPCVQNCHSESFEHKHIFKGSDDLQKMKFMTVHRTSDRKIIWVITPEKI